MKTDETRNMWGEKAERSPASPEALVRRAGADFIRGVIRARHTRRRLWRVAIALICAPAAAILLAGALAAVSLLGDLWQLGRAFSTHTLTSVPDTYNRLALAGRVALVSGTFLALLCALMIVTIGCRGRRWWRLYLLAGMPLTTVAALLFIFAVEWSVVTAFNQRLDWPPVFWDTLTALALADAVVVAALVGGIGAGPLGTRRARLRGRLQRGRVTVRITPRLASRQTQPIPVVRFGPRVTGVPTCESAKQEPPAEPSVPAAPKWQDRPTAEELQEAARHVSVGVESPDGAQVSAGTGSDATGAA